MAGCILLIIIDCHASVLTELEMTAETTDSDISSKTQIYNNCPDASRRCFSQTDAAAESELLFWIRI